MLRFVTAGALQIEKVLLVYPAHLINKKWARDVEKPKFAMRATLRGASRKLKLRP